MAKSSKQPQGVAPPADLATARRDPYMEGSGGWGIPQMTTGLEFHQVGSTGLRQYGGWVREEFLPALLGRQAARTYREMRDNSPIVGAVIFAITQSMRRVGWRVKPANDTPEAVKEAEFVESLMGDMTAPWDEFIIEALTMIVYGFAPHEIVYKRRLGPQEERGEVPPSRYNDGRIGIHKLPIRGQDTILKWFFDENGELRGLTQQPYVGPLIDIPVEKLLLFRPLVHKNNPEGYSVLRTAYRSWFFLKRLEEQEAIYLERMSGIPVMEVPSELLAKAQTNTPDGAQAASTLAQLKKIVTNVRVDEQMGVILPSDTFMGVTGPTAVKMFELKLLTPQGGRSGADFNLPIERHKLDILYSVLADFIQIGHGTRGTQSLAVSKVDLFMQAIEGWLNSVSSVLNRHLLPRIWDLNGLDLGLMPTFAPDVAARIDLDALGNFVLRLSQSGLNMFSDSETESYLRNVAGMPAPSTAGTTEEPIAPIEAVEPVASARLMQ